MPLFKDIPNFPGYQATDEGLIWSDKSWKYLQPSIARTRSGAYYQVAPWKDGRNVSCLVQHLVAAAFLPPKPEPHYVLRHLDGNGFNNKPENLCWGTRGEDAADKERHGTLNAGTHHGLSKLIVEQVLEIRSSTESCIGLAKKFNVNRETIRRAKLGESWRILQ